MPKVLCTLPNASEEIGGIKFEKHAKGMLSEDISDEQATRLASIPGYEFVGKPVETDDEAEAKAAEKAAEKAALLKRAEAAGLKVKGNWSNERLITEVDAAENAKADDAAAAAAAAADKEKADADAKAKADAAGK